MPLQVIHNVDTNEITIEEHDDMPAFTRELYPDEKPKLWFTPSTLREYYWCTRSCPSFSKELIHFNFANSIPRNGVQLATVFDDTLSLDNGCLMRPFANDHDHPIHPFMLSDVPPFSLVKISFSRPIIVYNHEGVDVRITVWVRDPFLTQTEIWCYCTEGIEPDRYRHTGRDRDGRCYPFNMDYLDEIARSMTVKRGKLHWVDDNGETGRYYDGMDFYQDRREVLPLYAGPHVFTYNTYDKALAIMEKELHKRYIDGLALALHEHLYNGLHPAPQHNRHRAKDRLLTHIYPAEISDVDDEIEDRIIGRVKREAEDDL
ncbi:hypothetical protein BDZ89DRAFT_1039104 [Hymenopellis radicata]|nr:hypothetical protein BDZ89DRAFT_1039104 [Hymenopellis radicata]